MKLQMRWVLALMLPAFGAACVAGLGGARMAEILGGQVVAAAPAGYCIAEGAGSAGADTAVVLMGRCSAQTRATAAVFTLSVGEAGSAGVMAAGPDVLAQFFATDDGRAMLSRDGRAEDVTLLQAVGTDMGLILHVNDTAAGDYWRGIIGLRGRLTTLSVAGPEGGALPADEGRRLLDAGLSALKRANSVNTN